ncbi:PAS domain S-box-containing protein/diguanylate cyclase (GGDEF)-like protein [Desulfobotulus alkaliphilus]|uniref:PAS domain S-box-containing protein/diguanylate cyclase (GGDEF)-like protein n=1 Tax=Desulfobotulus alkaliphilus TaxID=622671 RepID=A0A562RIE9_9BACT|nr:diguanylate cyclase [Desulfobotulus alkaliphilus]TWI68106.1 PAS domain S-box-containing protein/diguanylate cyclase (GGDEF)-like protein [Desulfobotulus alkaliphilus]
MLHSLCQRKSLYLLFFVFTGIFFMGSQADKKNELAGLAQFRDAANAQMDILIDTAILNYIKDFERSLEILALDDTFLQFARDPKNHGAFVRKQWKDFLGTHPHVYYIYFARMDGTIFFEPAAPLPEGYDARRRPWFRHALNQPGEILWTSPYVEVPTNRRVISVVTTIHDPESNEMTGVMGMDLLTEDLDSFLAAAPAGEKGLLAIFASDGQLVASPHPEKVKILQKNPLHLVTILNHEKDIIKMDEHTPEMLFTTRTLEQPPWRILQGLPLSLQNRQGLSMQQTALMVMAAILIFYILIQILFHGKARRKIKAFEKDIHLIQIRGPELLPLSHKKFTSPLKTLCRQLAIDLWRSEEKKISLKKQMETLIERAPIGIFISTPEGRFIHVNKGMAHILEYESPEDMILHIQDIAQELYLDRQDRKILKNRLMAGGVEDFPTRFRRKNGTVGHASITAYAEMGPDGHMLTIRGFFTDISRQRQLENQLRHMAHTDRLTGLPNRRSFMELITREAGRFCRYGTPFALLVLNMDHFRDINARYGHGTGDKILCSLAEGLLQALRSCDTLARIDGDTFAIHLAETDLEEGLKAALRFQKQIHGKKMAEMPDIYTTLSIGVAVPTETLRCPDLLLQAAESRMYQAKKKGGACILPAPSS